MATIASETLVEHAFPGRQVIAYVGDGGFSMLMAEFLTAVRAQLPVKVAIAGALAYDGPAIVDIDVDPNEPPMPGKIEYEQAKKFAQAFVKGQPNQVAIGTTLFKDKIQQLGR